jgi:hypothetical protein
MAQAYWKREVEKLVGAAGDVVVVGIPAIGSYPPAVVLRYPQTGDAFFFTMKSAGELQWLLSLWIQEQQGKLKLL